MPFADKITFIGFDKTGAILTVKDESNGTPYPIPTDVFKIRDIVSNLAEKQLYLQDITDVSKIASILAHTPYNITSISLGGASNVGFLPFQDGVLNLDHYIILKPLVAGIATKGDGFFYLTTSGNYSAFDSIVANDKLYTINKLLTTTTEIVIEGDFTEDVTGAYFAYRANTKILSDKVLKGRLARQAARRALCCDVSCSDLEGLGIYEFAQLAFEEGDYSTANRLISQCKCH